jgi:signal peptidase I
MSGTNEKRSLVRDTGVTLLSEGKTIRIKAHGYSMYPCIRPGSLIIIEPIGVKGEPKPGEIVAIATKTGMIIHRISRITVKDNIKYYIARGDSNAFADDPVVRGKIAGRVTGAEGTGENPVPADVRINTRPKYIINRLRVIALHLWKKLG